MNNHECIFDRFARFYDGDYRNYEDDLPLIADLAEENGGQLLELGCGTGRVLLPLAEMGYTLIGIDLSAELLEVSRHKLSQTPFANQVTLIQEDLRNFDLPNQQFDFVFCVSNTLMHLTTQTEQLAALRMAHHHLREDGALLIDLFNPDIARLLEVDGLSELADHWVDEETGNQIFKWCTRSLNLAEQIQETLFIYEEILPDGQVKRTPCPFPLRFLWRSEGELLLQMAGFQVEDVWGDFDGSPYDNGSERLIFYARKVKT